VKCKLSENAYMVATITLLEQSRPLIGETMDYSPENLRTPPAVSCQVRGKVADGSCWSLILYWSAVQIGRQGFMKARDGRIGHGRAKVTFGNARQDPSVSFSYCHAVASWKSAKQSCSAMSGGFVEADSTPPDDGKGG
jgi:hypothetical protein